MPVVYSTGLTEVLFHEGGTDYLLVTFGNFGTRANGADYFGRTLVEKNDINCISFAPRFPHWHPRQDISACIHAITDILKKYRIIVAYGDSMGGYGALKHADLLEAHIVIAGSPQFSIDPRDVPGDHRYRPYYDKSLHGDDMRIHAVPSEVAPIRRYALFDPLDADDMSNMLLISGIVDVRSFGLRYTSHYSARLLQSSDAFKQFIALAIAHQDEEMSAFLQVRRKQSWTYRLNLGRTCSMHGHMRTAESLFSSADQLGASAGDLQGALAEHYERRRDLDKAVESATRAKDMFPLHARGYWRLGRLLTKRWDLSDAEAMLRKAVELEPTVTEYHYDLWSFLNAQGRKADVVTLAYAAEPHFRLNAGFLRSLAALFSEFGELEQAEKWMRRASQIDNQLAVAINVDEADCSRPESSKITLSPQWASSNKKVTMVGSDLDWVNRLWEEHARPDAWNFFVSDLHNGDLFLFLSLLRPFRKKLGNDGAIRLITNKVAHCQLASLFPDAIDEVVHTPGATMSGRQVRDWRAAMGHSALERGTLINLYPPDYLSSYIEWGRLWSLFNDHTIYFVHLFKFLLELPLDIAPTPPLISEEAKRTAQALFEDLGLTIGRSLVLWPVAFSQPFMQDQQRVRQHFAALAARAAEAGFIVCTSVAASDPGGEIPGTRRIFVPFDMMIPFCELAGYAVVLRTGVSEVLSWAKCTKVNVYPSEHFAAVASPLAYGLGGTEHSVAFDLISNPDPERFARTVLTELKRGAVGYPKNYVPASVLELLRAPFPYRTSLGQFQRSEFVVRHDYTRVLRSGILAEGWWGLEDWGVWTNGYRSVLYLRPSVSDASQLADGAQHMLVIRLTFPMAVGIREIVRYSVEVNTEIYSHEVRWPDCWQTLQIPISAEQCCNPVRVTFMVDSPASTKLLSGGKADDDRVIGIGLLGVSYERESVVERDRRREGMNEQSKAAKRRFNDGAFLTRFFVGNGIDIGAGSDGLSRYARIFPLITDVRDWDHPDGDAQHLRGVDDECFDFLHSSHTLEHMADPRQALMNWIRVVRRGGHLIITVPDEDMYERGQWPGANPDHKVTFTVCKTESWSPVSINLVDLVREFAGEVELERLNLIRDFFEPEIPGDQTMTPNAECAIEMVLRRR